MSESTLAENATKPSVTSTSPLLEVRDLAVSFSNSSDPTGPRIQAVAGVSMTIHPKQTLAVVGGDSKQVGEIVVSVKALDALRAMKG